MVHFGVCFFHFGFQKQEEKSLVAWSLFFFRQLVGLEAEKISFHGLCVYTAVMLAFNLLAIDISTMDCFTHMVIVRLVVK